jgi:hypothetical protein
MYSRVYWTMFRPEEGDQVVRVAQESIPVHQALPGFRRVTYLYDRESGLGMAIELFDTQEQAESAVDHLQTVIDAFGAYAAPQPEGSSPSLGPDTTLPILEVIAEG